MNVSRHFAVLNSIKLIGLKILVPKIRCSVWRCTLLYLFKYVWATAKVARGKDSDTIIGVQRKEGIQLKS